MAAKAGHPTAQQARFSCCLLVLRVPGGSFEPFEQPVLVRRAPCCLGSSKELEAAPEGSLERAGLAVGGGPAVASCSCQPVQQRSPRPSQEVNNSV